MVRLPTYNSIDYLVARRFPSIFGEKNSTPTTRSISLSIELEKTDPKKRAQERAAYKSQLEKKTTEEIDTLVKSERTLEFEEKEADHLFNQSYAVATHLTYDHWSKAAYWTIEEAIALLLERNPKFLTFKSVQNDKKHSRIGIQFRELHDLATRAKEFGQLSNKNIPGFFVAWARRNRITMPTLLMDELDKHGVQVADWKSGYETENSRANELVTQLENEREKYTKELQSHTAFLDELKDRQNSVIRRHEQEMANKDEAIKHISNELKEAINSREFTDKPLSSRERISLLKLLIGMAVEQYGYNHTGARNQATKQIKDDLEVHGVGVSENTILKWLREAAELLPPKNKSN